MHVLFLRLLSSVFTAPVVVVAQASYRELVNKVLKIFKPGRFLVTVFANKVRNTRVDGYLKIGTVNALRPAAEIGGRVHNRYPSAVRFSKCSLVCWCLLASLWEAHWFLIEISQRPKENKIDLQASVARDSHVELGELEYLDGYRRIDHQLCQFKNYNLTYTHYLARSLCTSASCTMLPLPPAAPPH